MNKVIQASILLTTAVHRISTCLKIDISNHVTSIKKPLKKAK